MKAILVGARRPLFPRNAGVEAPAAQGAVQGAAPPAPQALEPRALLGVDRVTLSTFKRLRVTLSTFKRLRVTLSTFKRLLSPWLSSRRL
jgi:hypothetical protein